ncbi:hypothetical protein MQE36_12580 [Zhouia spongiae]|uniref:T9SS type A sorting domain-containing protein n=1 Tax=Zhouia spongiae TaxID=2202721 RepID=A0ABY3YK05_9FLAO|nr:MBG domain-containing protein [Zhouia spongiae]UNY97918.1 hypothetical protein MQE36_12580 [Zhouia spongiae]
MKQLYLSKLLLSKFLLLFCFLISRHGWTQTTYDFSTAPHITGSTSSNPWNTEAYITINGIDFKMTTGGNGSFEHQHSGGNGNSACLKKGSAGGDNFSLQRVDGQPFNIRGFWLKEEGINSYNDIEGITLPPFYIITYYKSGGGTETYQDNTPLGSGYSTTSVTNITTNLDVTSINIYFQANLNFWIDDIKIGNLGGNTTPTASNFTAANGPYENLTYTFSTANFGYNDNDGDPLNHLLIETLPGAGTLYVDADNDDAYDAGEEVSANDQISRTNLDAGNLQYIQNGSTNTSFRFEVNDGAVYSSGNYVATLNVSPVPKVTLSVSPGSRAENVTANSTVTATLSNTYGANTTVSLGFSGTAMHLIDYTRSATSIVIPAGSTSRTMTLKNIPDVIYEGNETVLIDIIAVSNGTENGTQQVTYTIINDDSPPKATLEILEDYNPITDESGGQAYVRGKIDAPAGVTVSIPLAFSGTATGGGTDYSITGSTITIVPGQMMDSIRLTSQFDGIEEGDETVFIEMNTPTNAVEDGTQQLTLTIQDEDAVPPSGYSVLIDQAEIDTSNETAVSFTFSGAEVGATYDYSFSSTGGGTHVTGTGTISTATDQLTGIDLSGLGDGTITLSVTLTDSFGNTGGVVTDTRTKDATAPSGYNVSIDQSPVNDSNQSAVSFTFSGAEVGATYDYSFSSTGGGTHVTGTGTISTATDQLTGIDLSGLGDGTITLSVTLTDSFGNTGGVVTDTRTKDATAPSGYNVSIDQSPVNDSNQSAVSFTFSGAEVGATYDYSFSSTGGGTHVTGTGTISTATDQLTGIDLSGLGDGIVTLSVSLTDIFDNTGSTVIDTENKDTAAPSAYSVSIDQNGIKTTSQSAVSFTFSGAEVGATYNYSFSSTGGGTHVTGTGIISTATDQITAIDLSGLGDGTITLSVILTDTSGNSGSVATDTEIKDTTAPSGYAITIDQSPVNDGNQSAVSFTFSGAEVGATYDYSFSSSGGGTHVTGTGTISTATDQVTGIDLSGLEDGTITLSVSLTDTFDNMGSPATDTAAKDTMAPSGYTVSIDLLGMPKINAANVSMIEFLASGLEVGSTLHYSFTSDGGGTPLSGTETVTSTSEQFDNGGAGYNLSGLTDGTVTLTVSLTDPSGNRGTDVTDSESKDTVVPSGYSVAWDDSLINAAEAGSTSFTVLNAEVGTTMNYSVSSSGDGNTATITGTSAVNNISQNIGVDVSSLPDGTLTVQVTLTDDGNNAGSPETDNSAELDQTAPDGYTAIFDQDPIDRSNRSSVSFTFAGAEVGSTYNYSFSSSGGGTDVIGSGTVTTTTDQISGIDLSGLGDGLVTLTVSLSDTAGNMGSATTDTVTKDTNDPPAASDVSIGGTLTIGELLTGNYIYTDPDGDAESGSAYKWYRSDDNGGTDKMMISGATAQQYTLQDADRGKYISFEVIPNDGIDAGMAVESTLEGPVKIDQVINFSSIPDKVYGDASFTLGDARTDQGLTVTYTADDPGVVSISGNQATILKAGNTQITATQGGDGVTNAAVSVIRTLTVDQAVLTVVAEDKTKMYGETDPDLTVSYAGFVNGDDETVLGGTLLVTRGSGEDVGTYVITASGLSSSDYIVNYVDGAFEITQIALTVTAENKSKIYGETDPAFTVIYDGFVNGDDQTTLGGTLNLSRVAGENVGNYTITATGYISSNYTITYVDGSLEILPATLTIVAAGGQTKVYGEADPEFNYTPAGFANGDTAGVLTGSLTREPGEDVGVYEIEPGNLSAGANYTLVYTGALFEITPAGQLISWNQDLSFGCDDSDQITLTATSDSGLPVQYVVADTEIATVNGTTLTIHQSGTTTITAYQEGDLNYNVAADVVNTLLVSQSGIIRQQWDDVLVFDNSSESFVSWQWYKNGEAVSGATKQYYTEEGGLNGIYYAEATDGNGNVITSCPLTVSGTTYSRKMAVMPNPVGGLADVTIRLDYSQATLDGARIGIYDLAGRELSGSETVTGETMMQAPQQPGLYIVVLTLSGGTRKSVNLLVR